jgi:hypothetical protein
MFLLLLSRAYPQFISSQNVSVGSGLQGLSLSKDGVVGVLTISNETNIYRLSSGSYSFSQKLSSGVQTTTAVSRDGTTVLECLADSFKIYKESSGTFVLNQTVSTGSSVMPCVLNEAGDVAVVFTAFADVYTLSGGSYSMTNRFGVRLLVRMALTADGLGLATGSFEGYLVIYLATTKGGTYTKRNNQNFRPISSQVTAVLMTDNYNVVFGVSSNTLYIYVYNSANSAYELTTTVNNMGSIGPIALFGNALVARASTSLYVFRTKNDTSYNLFQTLTVASGTLLEIANNGNRLVIDTSSTASFYSSCASGTVLDSTQTPGTCVANCPAGSHSDQTVYVKCVSSCSSTAVDTRNDPGLCLNVCQTGSFQNTLVTP